MRDEVEWEVERADRPYDADGKPLRERELPLARLRAVHRHHLAGERPRLDRSHRVGRHRARDLDARRLEWLAGLGTDEARRLVGPAPERPGDAHEDLGALVRRERLAHRPFRRVDRGASLVGTRLRNAGDGGAVPRRDDLDRLAGLDPLPVHEERARVHRRHGSSLGPCETSSRGRSREAVPDRDLGDHR